MPPVDPSAAAVAMGYPRNAYAPPNMNPNLNPAAMARMRHRGRDWDSTMNDPHDRDHEREAKRARTVLGVPPGPYPINPPPGMLRPPFNPPMYPGAISNPSQMPMQPPGQSQPPFGKAAGAPSHLHAHLHVHQPPIPFHQRRNMPPPHSAIPMGVAPQPPYSFNQQKPPFQRGHPQPLPLSADRLPAPPRKNVVPSTADPPSSIGGSSESAPQTNPPSSPRQSRRSNGPESFKDFLARQSDSISPAAAKDAYDNYVSDFTKRSPNSFFDLHKHEEWFRERYDPDYVCSRVQRVKKECQDRASDYRNLWNRGGSNVCAPDISSNVLAAMKDSDNDKSKVEPVKEEDDQDESSGKDIQETLATCPDVLKDSDDPFVADGNTSPGSDEEGNPSKEDSDSPKDEGTIDMTDDKMSVQNEETKSNPINSPENGSNDEQMSDKANDKGKQIGDKKEDEEDDRQSERNDNCKEQLDDDCKDGGKNRSKDDHCVKHEDERNDEARKSDCDMKENSEGEERSKAEVIKEHPKEEKKEEPVETSKEEAFIDTTGDASEDESEGELDSNTGQDVGKQTGKSCDDENVPSGLENPCDESDTKKPNDSSSSLVLPLRREHEKNTIFLRGIPINLARDDLTKVLAHGPNGDMDLRLRRVKIGDINPTRSLQRFAWAVYADESAAARALNVVKGVLVKTKRKRPKDSEQNQDGNNEDNCEDGEKDVTAEYVIDCMLNLERKKKYTQGRVLPDLFGSLDRMALDLKQSLQIMRCLDKTRELLQELNPLTDGFLEKLASDGRRLDHIITYLREVHYYCYYSGNEFLEDATSMPPQELRPVLKEKESNADSDMRMLKRVDERTKWVLERDYDRPRSNSNHAEKEKAEAVEKWLNENTINEGQGRFRCKLPPNKLFKAPEFVHKHLKTRHADRMKAVVEKAMEDVYRKNFENDPSKEEVISFYNEGSAGFSNERGPSNQRKLSNFNSSGGNNNNDREPNEFPAGSQMGPMRPTASTGMFNPTQAYMGLGMQQMPMMMMPGSGFPYPNTMPFGRGMAPGTMGGRMEAMDVGRGNAMRLPGAGPPVGKEDMGGERGMWRGAGSHGDGEAMSVPGIGPGPVPGPGRKGSGIPMGGGPMVGSPGVGVNRMSGRGGGGGHGGHGHHGHHGHHGGRSGGYDGGPRPNQYHRGGRRGGGRRGRHDHGESLDPRAMGPRRNYTDLDAPAQGPSFDLVRYDDV